jgi:Resolvase, N terminal domain
MSPRTAPGVGGLPRLGATGALTFTSTSHGRRNAGVWRSPSTLVGFLSELHALGIDLFLHQQGLDTTTPAGKAIFQMMGVFAEFERAMIQERVRAGLARALWYIPKQTPKWKVFHHMANLRLLTSLCSARKDFQISSDLTL